VCPLLIDLQPTDVEGPLAQFQATRVSKADILRLLKTLNTALGRESLAESHIEEAFEVWWPRLDDQFKSLPPEDVESRPIRTDRDVLDEILGFVRNQNRSSTPSLSEGEEILGFVRNQNRSSAPGLSEDDKKHILAARAWKVFRDIHGQIGGSAAGPVRRGNDIEYHLSPSKDGKIMGKYVFLVPADASPDEMEVLIQAQIRETDQLSKGADAIAKAAQP
jgi:hypothetical protein